MRRLALVGFLLSICMAVQAHEGALKAGHPNSYTVKPHDTLWDISNTFLDSPWLWKDLWYNNPHITNPHLLFPGDVLKLVYIGGEPRLMVESSDDHSRTIKLEPSVRVMSRNLSISAIPLQAISSHLSLDYLFSTEFDYEKLPYVFTGDKGRLFFSEGDRIYAKGEMNERRLQYSVVRRGKDIVDPDSGEMLGFHARYVGLVQAKSHHEDVSVLEVQKSEIELKVGDRLIPVMASGLEASYFPQPAPKITEGKIIMSDGESPNVTLYDSVIINKGEADKLEEGHILAVYHPERTMIDPVSTEVTTLPAERIGLVMVYRVFDEMSYAIVLSVEQELKAGYLLKQP